jgi:hypothetical protein
MFAWPESPQPVMRLETRILYSFPAADKRAGAPRAPAGAERGASPELLRSANALSNNVGVGSPPQGEIGVPASEGAGVRGTALSHCEARSG